MNTELNRENDIESVPPSADHFLDDLGWILQIRVHDDHGVALRAVEAGRDRHLVAEIPRERQDFVAPLGRSQLLQQSQ